MPSFKSKNDRLLTAGIVLVSVAGMLYFGIGAVKENITKRQDNPFEYNVDQFKEDDEKLYQYIELQQISIPMEDVFGITVTSDDHIAVSGPNSILVFGREGGILATIPTGASVRCLVEDEENNLYFGLTDHIEVYDRNHVKKAQWPSLGEKAWITSIAVTREDVYVADAGNRVVWQFDKSGKMKRKIGEKNESKEIPGFIIPSPFFDLAIDPDGFLWIVNPGRHTLENYTPEGDFRSSWGQFSMHIEGFCGCCNPSHILILEDGSFVTSEKGIVRVKVHNALGNLVSVVAGSHQFAEGSVGLDLAKDSDQRIYVLDPSRRAVRVFVKHG